MEPFSLAFQRKRHGGRQISGQFVQGEKKNGINLKMIWFQECFIGVKKILNFVLNLCNAQKLNLSTEEYKAGHPLHNKHLIDFTDLFGSVELIFRYLIMIIL